MFNNKKKERMKKIYLEPNTIVVDVRLTLLQAASPDGFNKALDTTGKSGSAALGRRGWADDEDED